MLETLANHLDSIAALAPALKFTLIFVFMAVESSFIPFPSEVVMIPAGFMAGRVLANGATELGGSSPTVALAIAIVLGIAGSLAGAYVNYFLSAWLGKPFLEKYGKYFFVKPEPLARACEVFNKYGAATTFVCRLVPVIRQLISIPAGISKMPLGSFTLFTGLGAGIWTVILALVGFGFGHSTADLSYLELVTKGKEMASHNLPWVILGALVLVGLYWGASKLVMGKKKA